MRIGVLASGRGSNLQALLDAEKTGVLGAHVSGVLGDHPDAPVLERARIARIPGIGLLPGSYHSKNLYEQDLVRHLDELKVDLVVLAGYMRVLGPVFLQAYGGRIINIHPSLLPAFPGLDAQQQALDYGVKISGCTVHFVDEDIDTGPIIAQQAVAVEDGDDRDRLSMRILEAEHQLLPRVVNLLAQNRVRRIGRQVWIEKKEEVQ